MPLDDLAAAAAQQWLATAEGDLLADRAAAPPAILAGMSFHSQQAAEKALKGFLVWKGQPIAKTHDLRFLVQQCVRIEAEFGTLLDAADTLNQYLAAGRYPGDAPEPTLEEAEEAYRRAGEVVAFVQARIPPRVRP